MSKMAVGSVAPFGLRFWAFARGAAVSEVCNVELLTPFVRSLATAAAVLDILKKNGLKRSVIGLKVNKMAVLPSNVILAEEFPEYFDVFL